MDSRPSLCLGGVFTQTVQNRNVYLSRGKDVPTEVLKSIADVGFCGSDVYKEGQLSGEYRPLGFKPLMGAGCDLVLAGKPGLNLREPLRIATSFPLQAIARCQQKGYDVDLDRLCEFGGKIEGKLSSGAFNAIVDLRSSGETLEDNGLVVYDCLDTIQTGLVFRKEGFDFRDITFDPWRIYAEAQTLGKRAAEASELAKIPSTKSTLQLLADGNKRRKNLGEEAVELAVADVTGDNILGETADLNFAVKLSGLANGFSVVRQLNEQLARNTNLILPLN